MDKKAILKNIKKIEIASNLISNEIFSGNYHSFFKGNGMEFSDIRRYAPGDDAKKIDWKVTARQKKAYVKEFIEERELTLYLLIDVSKSSSFPEDKLMIAELFTTLAFSANNNGDRVGAIFFSDKIEKFIPQKKGKKHALSILDSYLSLNPVSTKTNITGVLNYFNKIVKRRSIVILISDFLDEEYEKALKLTSQKHDLIPIKIINRRFEKLPKGAVYELVDSETGEEIILENFKNDFKLVGEENSKFINLFTNEDYVKPLSNYFKRRG
jgi:uncharacterized protein (DUF58 family)